MRRILLSLIALLCLSSGAVAQNVICSTAPSGDSSNRCASTQFVQDAIGTFPDAPTFPFGIIDTSPSMASLLANTGFKTGARIYLTQYDASTPNIGGGFLHVLSLGGQPFYGLPTITNGGSGYNNGTHVVSLLGGGGSGATVNVVVSGGVVRNVLWGTAGTGYTSAPTFNWSDLPGSGTPGTITFTLSDGGVYIRTTSGALLVREEFLEHGIVRPEWWGAKGIQSGDDAPAINLMFSFLRTTSIFINGINYAAELRGRARYNILSPIDVTRFRAQTLVIRSNGALLHVRIAGGVGLDFTNSRNVTWYDLALYGDATLTPKYGAVLAIQTDLESSAWNEFPNANFYGFFTDAAVYNMASEFNAWPNSSLSNSNAVGGAIILDPMNSRGWSSSFAPAYSLTANSWHPMSEFNATQSRFISNSDTIVSTGPLIRAIFRQVYAPSFGGSSIALYRPSGTGIDYTDCVFDTRGEPRPISSPTPVQSMIKFYTAGGGINLFNTTISDYGEDYQVAVLVNSGGGNVRIEGGRIDLGAATYAGGGFASGGNIQINANITIARSDAGLYDFSGLSSLRGTVTAQVAFATAVMPALYEIFWNPREGFGTPGFYSATSQLQLPLRITIGTTQIREYTSDPEGNVIAPQGSLLLRKTANDSNSTLYLKVSGSGNTGWRAVPSDIAALVIAAASKSTPVAADQFALVDSADSNILKKLSWADLKNNIGWYKLASSAVASSVTGTTTETALATITIPGSAMGPNGSVKITTLWTYTSSANNKIIRHRFGGMGGASVGSLTATTTANARWQTEVHNRNLTNSQIAQNSALSGGFGIINAAVTTAAVNTTAAVDIVLTGQLTDAGETITLEYYTIEVMYGSWLLKRDLNPGFDNDNSPAFISHVA